jgi:hypothetical protein
MLPPLETLDYSITSICDDFVSTNAQPDSTAIERKPVLKRQKLGLGRK